MTHDIRLIDGQKSVRLEDFPKEAWQILTGGPTGGDGDVKKMYEAVPWLFRGVDVRASAISNMPFTIYDGENEYDTSENYQNKLGWWPNPEATLYLTEASLALTGRAYLNKVRANRLNVIQSLRYLLPTSITPKIDEELGLVGFKRRLKSESREIPMENLVWIWMRSAFTEIGPPSSSPAKNAMRAAGVLFNVDTFVESFFERGAIKASILAVPRATQPDERAKLKSWWKKAVTGVKNAFASNVISAEDVIVRTIGEGISELANTDLTNEKREDISVALGVPQNILFSDEAFVGSAKMADFRLYQNTVNPQSRLIQGAYNSLLLNPIGFSIKFHPETLSVSQEEETLRSGALVNLERAFMPPWIGVRILGYDLPPDMDYDTLEQEIRDYQEYKAGLRLTSSDNTTNPITPTPTQPRKSVLDQYRDHALKRHKAGKSIKGTNGAPPFDHGGELPEALVKSIGGALANARNEKDIRRIFADAEQWESYP